MEIAGELRAPRLEGYLGLTTGQINVDELVDFAGPTPYATEPASYDADAAPASAERRPFDGRGLFDRLQLNVELSVPNDLVVKSRQSGAAGRPDRARRADGHARRRLAGVKGSWQGGCAWSAP
mgnify:CR=1 FL=1